MKKLMVFSVVFALVAGAGLFAADLSAEVFAGIRVLETSNNKVDDGEGNETGADIIIGGEMARLRVEGSGGNDTFGAWLRVDNGSSSAFNGTVWWKPIDQLKISVGKNPDGYYGKEGWAGWMFYQMPSEVGVVTPGSVWGSGYYNLGWRDSAWYRQAFFGGYEGDGLMVDIMPVDIFNMTIGIPFFNGGEIINAVDFIMAQFNVNLNFGNIALTYWGSEGTPIKEEADFALTNTGRVYLSTDITAVPNLGLDFSVGFPIPASDGDKELVMDNIAIGLGVKYDVVESFGFKARLLTALAGNTTIDGDTVEKKPFFIGLDLLPYYTITDIVKIFIGLGMVFQAEDQVYNGSTFEVVPDTGRFGWHFNPYVQVGAEWGPTFYAGIKIYSNGEKNAVTDYDGAKYTPIYFQLPIGFIVSF